MIRIAYCASSSHGGGALNYLVDLVEHHDRTRFASTVWLAADARDVGSAVRRLEAAGADVRRGVLPSRPLAQFRGADAWARELREAGPFDIAALHQHVPAVGVPFLAGAARAGIAVRARTEQLPRYPPEDFDAGAPLRWPRWLLQRLARRRAAGLTHVRIAVAEAGRRALAARGEPLPTIHVVPSAYNEAAFADVPPRATTRRALGVADDALVVLFLASLSQQKRPDVFLDAAARLLGDGCDATFLVGGSGPLADDVARRVATMGPRVVPIGPRSDVPAVLAACDVFVLPSLWEGLPLTVLEAMRAGAAVVASDVDGTGEVVRHGETGLLVPPGDVDALAAALRELLADAALRTRLAAAGTAHVRGRYDAATLARRTEAVYDAALAAGRG